MLHECLAGTEGKPSEKDSCLENKRFVQYDLVWRSQSYPLEEKLSPKEGFDKFRDFWKQTVARKRTLFLV